MQLLTFLGTGRYQPTRYHWQDQEKETAYVAEALCEFFQPQEVKVFVTQEAKEAHWNLLEKQISPKTKVSDILIPSGKSQSEIWQIFDAVVSAVEPESQVLFDITHAFRSIPLLVLLASAFLQKARQVQIKGVYYGAFEVNREHPPIFDLTPAIKLLDWLTATDKFISTGSSLDLGNLLSSIQQDFYTQSSVINAEIKPVTLKKIGDRISIISRSIELIRPMDLMEETAKLDNIPIKKLEEEIGIFAKPFELILEQIQSDYRQFALPKSRKADPKTVLQKKFLLLRWYVAKELGAPAILLAREWIISAVCVTQNLPFLDKDTRENITDKLGKCIGENPQFDLSINEDIEQVKRLAGAWSKLVDYRNDVAHTQMRATKISGSTLQKYVKEELLNEIVDLFPQYTV